MQRTIIRPLQNRWRWFTCVWVVEILACQQSSYQGSHLVSGEISLTLALSFRCFLHPSCRSRTASRVSTFPPSTVSQFLCFSFLCQKVATWPAFSELCLKQVQYQELKPDPSHSPCKRKKNNLASQLPALGRPASVWEDKRKDFSLSSTSFLRFLFILPFIMIEREFVNSVQRRCLENILPLYRNNLIKV